MRKMIILVTIGALLMLVSGQTSCQTTPALRANCKDLLLYEGVPSGVYQIDPDGSTGPTAPFKVYCDMTTDGGGWTLAFLKNSAHAGNYADFGAGYVAPEVLVNTPETASNMTQGLGGWLDLNALTFDTIRLASYNVGARTFMSKDIAKTSLRIKFGDNGYLLYNDSNGYYWCGGDRAYTDSGSGQVNQPSGAPADCKGHGSLGDGWDFSHSTGTNQGLTLCGANASSWMYRSYGSQSISYGTVGAAYAIWAR
jgi:hypothetical protein